MKAPALLFLRVSLGLLMVWWGIDKLVNVEHGIDVANAFYGGVGASAVFLQGLGLLQILLGVLVIIGLARSIAYLLLLVITAVTAVGVWKSIVDPWGWALEGSNVLFYPSLIILAGAVVLWAFRDQDTIALDPRFRRGR